MNAGKLGELADSAAAAGSKALTVLRRKFIEAAIAPRVEPRGRHPSYDAQFGREHGQLSRPFAYPVRS